MTRSPELVGRLVCVAPDGATSYWQPRPANGHLEVVLTPEQTGHPGFVQGFQSVAVGGAIRPHQHADITEFLVCLSGRGRIVTDEHSFDFIPEAVCFIGHDVRHTVINDGEEPLRLMWVQFPPGHERLFPLIGRRRNPGDPAPEPFDRPAEAAQWASNLGVTFTTPDPPRG